MNKEYSVDLQKLFLEMMLQDAQTYVRVQNIYNPENFDRSLYLMNINTLKKNDIGYKIGNNILHRIICKKPAKSLHIYIPGNYKCNYF